MRGTGTRLVPLRSTESRRAPRSGTLTAPALRWVLLIAAGIIATATPASARITRTRRTPTERWNPFLPLTIGGGYEFERDEEERHHDFPLLIEYNFTEQFKISFEPNFVLIDGKTPDTSDVGGFGDLETSFEWEFIPERRFRPAVTAEGIIKWPTATDADLGEPGYDYSAGLILSKDLVHFDLDLDMLYTFSGDRSREDVFEMALATEIPLNHFLSIEAEVDHVFGTGGVRGRPGTIGGIGAPSGSSDETQGTIGLAWQVNPHLKLEQGFVLSDGGHWQVVFAWEWSFGGED